MDTIRIAENMVGRFQSEDPVVLASNEAGECHFCEQKLQIGIQACDWLFTASEAIRIIYVQEIEVKDIDFESASSKIRYLYKWWLSPCDDVEAMIVAVENKGYQVSNKDKYFECKSLVEQKLRVYALRDASSMAQEDGFFDGAFDAASRQDD